MNRTTISLALMALLFTATPTLAEERILADDGREVLLKDDGSWEYVSEDRFGTTGSGERVRLKGDGSWEIVSDAPVALLAATSSLSDSGPAIWALGDVIIETSRSQRSGTKKGGIKKTQAVFTLQVRGKAEASAAQTFSLEAGAVSVTDSGGRDYPVLSVEPSSVTVNADRMQTVVVRVDGSPHWFTTKFYELRIAADAVGNRDEIRLKRALSNVQRRDIES